MRISAWRSDVCASDLPCMLLVTPLEKGSSPVVAELAAFFDETLGFTPNSVLTMQRRPEIAEAFINLNKAVMMNDGRVTSSEERRFGKAGGRTSHSAWRPQHETQQNTKPTHQLT